MKNLSKEKRDKLILIGIGTLGVLVGLWFGVARTQNSKIEAKNKQLTELVTELGNAERIIASREETQRELDEHRSDLERIENGMVQGDMYAWMIQTINDFKTAYKVSIPQISRENLDVTPYRNGFPYESAMFKIQGSAHFHDLGKFIADFENRYPFMKLQNLRVSKGGMDAKGGEVASGVRVENQSEELTFSLEIVSLIKPTSII